MKIMNSNESRCIVSRSVDLKNNFKSLSQRRYPNFPVCGGSFSDFELAWLYNGPILRIYDASNGTIVSTWDFSLVTHDDQTEVTSIIEYVLPESMNRSSPRESQLYFIVSYISRKDSSKASRISLCHPRTSRILHTISTEEKVTHLSLISAKKDHSSPITGIVKLMCGTLAVGTSSGNVLIVDIREILSSARQGCSDRVYNRSSELVIIDSKQSENIIKERLNKADEFHHIALSLSVSDRKDPQDGNLTITALMYIPQCTMLAVGLGNGVFQLWDVCTLKRVHRSGLAGVPMPVVKFGFQEPCNDPQSFCYLWVLYESGSKQNECLPFAIMYACLFKKITTAPEYGIHYKNFVHCKKRFDLDVDLERCVNGRCIACGVVSNTPSNILRHVTFAEEDTSKINLFVIVFETWEQITDNNSCLTLIIFDMNQWYKAQLPQTAYHGGTASFVSFLPLENVSERKWSVMDLRIRKDTVQQFLSFNLSEEYTYPSSLSCDAFVITDTKLIHARILGAQRNILDKIVTEGPSGIINPSKYFSECKEAGLWPCFSNTYSQVFVPNQIQQRNFILTVLLEHKFSSFLVQCANQWADGSRGVSGCTLPNLMKWAWDCVTRIKQLTDTVCIPLFDYSGDDLDRENYQKLKHCVQLMHTIKDFLAFIYKNYKQYLLEDVKLKLQLDALKLTTKYFDIIIWCLDCNLLPEKVTSSSEKCVPTYMMSLIQFTEQRRDELRKMLIKDQHFLTPSTTLYIIDSILEQDSSGKQMQLQWERESGGLSNGLYPPVTLQSLLRMFLVPGLSNDSKHFIMIYFLLDVCDYHRDEEMKEQLLSFAVVFSINLAFFSLVQACWYIDHEKFEDAAGLLLSDHTISQLKNRRELYRTLLLALVSQGQYQLALRIERLMKMSRTVFNDDTFYVTLLLLNGLVMDAYLTIRENTFKQNELLKHFFKVCDNLGYLKEIFKFPLSPKEEEEFMVYLDTCDNKDSGDLKVMYLLSRGKYVEAIDVNHHLSSIIPRFKIVGQDTTKQKTGVGRTTTRDLLVNAFSKTLPAVTNDLINFCRKEKNKIARFKAVSKPTPLSVVVHTDTSQPVPIYKSSFESVMEAAICKTAETWANVPEILRQKRGHLGLKNTPFLRSNLVTPRKNNSVFLRREELPATDEKKKDNVDVDEPPTKRMRKSIFVSDDNNVDDVPTADESVQLSTSAETNQLLCTPHVQKRLNKLLLNTPESSPLTSILKSAESRFRQPQKVGFSVPERDVRRSKRLSAIHSTSSPEKIEEKLARKSAEITELHSNENRTSERMETSVDESVNTSFTSTAHDSFYSLDSDSDNALGLTDFVQEDSTFVHSSKSIVDSTREDVPSFNLTSSKLIIETMSEEDTPKSVRASKLIIESMSEEETSRYSRPSLIIENMSEDEISQSNRSSDLTFGTAGAKEGTRSNRASTLANESISKNETLIPTCLRFDTDEVEAGSKIIQVDVHASPSEKDSVSTMEISEGQTPPTSVITEEETVSLTALQPVDQTDHVVESYSRTSFREDFSIDTYEKETLLEQCSQEITSTNSEDDSDIEILAESLPAKHVAAERDENSSDRSYESDFSYSHDSAHTDSEVVEDDLLDVEDENSSIEEENVSMKEGDEVEEEEIEDEDEEEDIEEEEDTNEEEEEEAEESVCEMVHELSDDEADDEEDEEKDTEVIDQDKDIDYDSLKKIINAVNEAENNKTELTNPSSSFQRDESTASVYEILNIDLPNTTVEEQNSSSKSIDDSVNQSLDTSVEVVSVSGITKDETANEPEMVFYFGENSVTSISEKLLSDESMNERQLNTSETEISQKTSGDFSTLNATEEVNVGKFDEGETNVSQVRSSYGGVDDFTQKREDFSLMEVVEERDDDIEDTKISVDMSQISYQEQKRSVNEVSVVSRISNEEGNTLVDEVPDNVTNKTEDYSIVAVIEERDETTGSSGEGTDSTVQGERSYLHLHHVSSRKSKIPFNGSKVVAQEPEKAVSSGEEIEISEELNKRSYQSNVEEITVRENIDESRYSNISKQESIQPQYVSIGCVEEMVGDETQETDDILNETVRSDKSQEDTNVQIISPNESRPNISIDIAEEIVASNTQRSEDFSISRRTRRSKYNIQKEDASNAKTIPTGMLVPEPITTESHDSVLPTSEQKRPAPSSSSTEIPNQNKTLQNVTFTKSTSEDNQNLITQSRNSDNIITSDSQLVSEKLDPVSVAPRIEKAESEHSFTMCIPDSPAAPQMEKAVSERSFGTTTPDSTAAADIEPPSPAPDTPSNVSRRSARIARKLSTDSLPQAVTTESPSILTRANRKRSIDSTDAASLKSDASVAESVGSRASKSGARKRSFTRLEQRKSSIRPPFRQLEVIPSDEELTTEDNALDEDQLSEASSQSRRSSRRSSARILNTAVLPTPSPPKKRITREFLSAASGMSPKTEIRSDNYEDYAGSRRLTRHQKSLLDCGITRHPQKQEPLVLEPMDVTNDEDTQPDSSVQKMKQPIASAPSTVRSWKEKLREKSSARSTRSSVPLKREGAIPLADSDSSDDSTRSRASTASRRSKTARRTGTRVELRKSSIKPYFKPLSVISSDEESMSQSVVEDEPGARFPTTRSKKRTQKNESEHSDRESVFSDRSESTTAGARRRTRQSIALGELSRTPQAKSSSAIPSDEESTSQTIVEDESSDDLPTTRSKKRSKKNESEHSDHESVHSDWSENATAGRGRRTRRSIAIGELSKATPTKSQKSAQAQGRMNEFKKVTKESSKK